MSDSAETLLPVSRVACFDLLEFINAPFLYLYLSMQTHQEIDIDQIQNNGWACVAQRQQIQGAQSAPWQVFRTLGESFSAGFSRKNHHSQTKKLLPGYHGKAHSGARRFYLYPHRKRHGSGKSRLCMQR